MDMNIVALKKLCEYPTLYAQAVQWFSQKWDIPTAAYLESMGQCLLQQTSVPQWYLVLDEQGAFLPVPA